MNLRLLTNPRYTKPITITRETLEPLSRGIRPKGTETIIQARANIQQLSQQDKDRLQESSGRRKRDFRKLYLTEVLYRGGDNNLNFKADTIQISDSEGPYDGTGGVWEVVDVDDWYQAHGYVMAIIALKTQQA